MDMLSSPVSLTFQYQRKYHLTQLQRPQIMVDFRNFDQETGKVLGATTRVNVLIDSGCDVTLLPERYANSLGINNIRQLEERSVAGISGRVRCYGKVVLTAYLCDKWIGVPVYFFSSSNRVGLLGRSGAFDALQLAFVNKHRTLYAGLVPGV